MRESMWSKKLGLLSRSYCDDDDFHDGYWLAAIINQGPASACYWNRTKMFQVLTEMTLDVGSLGEEVGDDVPLPEGENVGDDDDDGDDNYDDNGKIACPGVGVR